MALSPVKRLRREISALNKGEQDPEIYLQPSEVGCNYIFVLCIGIWLSFCDLNVTSAQPNHHTNRTISENGKDASEALQIAHSKTDISK
jgi:hypothetical protein